MNLGLGRGGLPRRTVSRTGSAGCVDLLIVEKDDLVEPQDQDVQTVAASHPGRAGQSCRCDGDRLRWEEELWLARTWKDEERSLLPPLLLQ